MCILYRFEREISRGHIEKSTFRYRLNGDDLYFLELESADAVVKLRLDFSGLARTEATAVIVTSASSATEYDFVSRFFAPGVGISEDPVTGLAHCYLAPFWADLIGKRNLVGYQASARGGSSSAHLIVTRLFLVGTPSGC